MLSWYMRIRLRVIVERAHWLAIFSEPLQKSNESPGLNPWSELEADAYSRPACLYLEVINSVEDGAAAEELERRS